MPNKAYLHTIRGKCLKCRVVYVWSPPPLLRDRSCPTCGKFLERTAYVSRRGLVGPPGGYNQVIL